MKYIIILIQLIIIVSPSSGQNQSTNPIVSDELIIEINDLGVSINSIIISDSTKLTELIDVIGQPSRSNIPDETKVEEIKKKLQLKYYLYIR